jgi:glucosamine--fructose-6-phosphate aminotransferase (isomerizing)
MKRFAYDTQLASIPDVVAELTARTDGPRLDARRPIVFSGIGTSLHAARVAADWVSQLTAGRVRATAFDAHDIGTGTVALQPADQLVVISHRGKKIFPNAALRRAREVGCHTVSIVGNAAPEQPAHETVRTCADETAGTFSVSYLASLTALAQIVARTFPTESEGLAAALPKLPTALAASLKLKSEAAWVAGFANSAPILISGFGPDLATAQEAALKIKEGAWLWTEAMSPEFALHGTPVSYHAGMGAVVMAPASDDGGRSALLLQVLKRLGLKTVASCGPVETGAELRFAAPPHPLLRPLLAILPFHLLTAELARVRGSDPDTLHGHREPWKGVMADVVL